MATTATVTQPASTRAAADRATRRRRWLTAAAIALLVLVALLYSGLLYGDAQVHLAIAERFAAGEPFRYNPGGEIVNATTSPFWTLLLTAAYATVGGAAPIVLKLLSIGVFALSAWLLWRTSGMWRLPELVRWGLLFVWIGSFYVAANSLAGLENILAGVQILLILAVLTPVRGRLDHLPRAAAVGVLLGWMSLTRLDVTAFAVLMVLAAAIRPVRSPDEDKPTLGRQFLGLVVAGVVMIAVAAPWFVYQHAETGMWLSDSMRARLNEGRLSGLPIIPGIYFWHPQDLLVVFLGYLPIFVGACVGTARGLAGLVRRTPAEETPESFLRGVSVVPFLLAVVAYTGLAGLEHFNRYFLSVYALLFLLGGDGGVWLYRKVAARREGLAKGLTWAAVVFMVLANLAITANFVGRDRFGRELPDMLAGYDDREAATTQTLAALGAGPDDHVEVAVREVQVRYFWDDRIDVFSLDGRSSRESLDAFDAEKGQPDFATMLEQERPEFVVTYGWCYKDLLGAGDRSQDSLLCDWQHKADELGPGASWDWNGHTVSTLPDDGNEIPDAVQNTSFEKDRVVRIDW